MHDHDLIIPFISQVARDFYVPSHQNDVDKVKCFALEWWNTAIAGFIGTWVLEEFCWNFNDDHVLSRGICYGTLIAPLVTRGATLLMKRMGENSRAYRYTYAVQECLPQLTKLMNVVSTLALLYFGSPIISFVGVTLLYNMASLAYDVVVCQKNSSLLLAMA